MVAGLSGWIFAEVTGISPSVVEATTLVPFPTGFTRSNSFIIQTMIDVDQFTYPINKDFYSFLTDGQVGVFIISAVYTNRPFKTLLARKS